MSVCRASFTLLMASALIVAFFGVSFPRTRYGGLPARIPTIVRLRDIVCGWPLGVTILAVVKTVVGTSWNSERRTKAIALYIGAAAKWARIKFHVTHVPGSAMFAGEAAGESIEGFTTIAGRLCADLCTNSF
jgi:hypothetical protein